MLETLFNIIFSLIVLIVAVVCIFLGSHGAQYEIDSYPVFYYRVVVLTYGILLFLSLFVAWISPNALVKVFIRYLSVIYIIFSIVLVFVESDAGGGNFIWFLFTALTCGGCSMIIGNLCERGDA